MNDASRNAASSVSDLVSRALRRDNVVRKFDIASNQASGDLKTLGPAALPAIESALLTERHVSNGEVDLDRRFPGLSDVLVLYFDMTREHDIRRAAELLRSLSPQAQVHALRAIWSIWLGRSKFGPVPEDLLNVIRELAGGDADQARDEAKALLAAYNALGPRRRGASAEKL